MTNHPEPARTHAQASERLARMIGGYLFTQALHVAVKLRLAELLTPEPRELEDLARAAGAEPRALKRLLRALSSEGVFAETEDGRWTLTPEAELLRSGAPGALGAWAELAGEECVWHPWGAGVESVRTGRPAFEQTLGMPPYAWFAAHPQVAHVFHEALAGEVRAFAPALVEACRLQEIAHVVDLGGGRGELLGAALNKYSRLQGTLCEHPAVLEMARATLQRAGLLERCALLGGDFLEMAPADADAYVLMRVLHNLNDPHAARLLSRLREKITCPAARLLCIEKVVPDDLGPAAVKFGDLNMLVLHGGQERTQAEFRVLLASEGWKLNESRAAAGGYTVLESTPSI